VKQDQQVVIRTCGNGYIVRAACEDRSIISSADNELIFQTLSGLLRFLDGHFTYRAKNVPDDVIVGGEVS